MLKIVKEKEERNHNFTVCFTDNILGHQISSLYIILQCDFVFAKIASYRMK